MKTLKNIIIISDYTYVEGAAAKVAIDTANILSNDFNCVFISPSYKCMSQLNEKVQLWTTEQGDCLSSKNRFRGMINGIRNRKFYNLVCTVLKKYSPEDTVINVHGWTKACSAYFFKAISKYKFDCFLTLHDYFIVCPNGGFFNYKKERVCSYSPCSFKCIFSNCDSRNYIFKMYRLLRNRSYKKFISEEIKFICVSEFQRKIIEKYTNQKKYVLENPCHFTCTNGNEKKYDFAFIGRTTPEKGFTLFEKLVSDYENSTFLLVGEKKNLVNKKNLTCTGWVSEEEVISYLSQSRCLIFPSLWPETYGLNVRKALILNIPCIVSSNTYASSIKDDKIIVFEQGNYEDLCKKIDFFLCSFTNNSSSNHENEEKYENKLINIFLDEHR